ncbi:MAG: hypothetical protein ABH951_00495 [Patescibacteria group bacterium]
MGIFKKIKSPNNLVLVFDVGSSSVGAAFFRTQKSGVPRIIYSIREPILLEKNIDPERFLESSLKSFELIVKKVASKGIGVPAKVFCVLSSPWYASQTRIIKLEKDESFVFDTKLADSLIDKEVKAFKDEHFSNFIGEEDKIRIIELKNMKISLNGYTISSPLNQKVKSVEMMVFFSMSPENVLLKLERIIDAHYHGKEVKFSSFSIASFTVARDTFVLQDNFLLVDIGGEITDISMIKKDIICSSISFPLGRNFMIREVALALKCSLSEAKSFISLFKDGHAIESLEKKLEPIIDDIKTKWLKGFQESLVSVSNDISIPASIFITVDQDLADFFSKIIKTEQFSQYTLTEAKFRTIFLGTEALHGIAIVDKNMAHDAFLIIESIYINRFLR